MKLSELLFEQIEEENKVRYVTDGGEPLPHHVSLTKFKPYGDPSKLGKEYQVQVNGVVVDPDINKVVAVGVTLPEDVEIATGNPAHITVGLYPGGKPFNSSKLDYSKMVPIGIASVNTKLVNTDNNSMFAEDYNEENINGRNAQLVLTAASSERLKAAVEDYLKQ